MNTDNRVGEQSTGQFNLQGALSDQHEGSGHWVKLSQ